MFRFSFSFSRLFRIRGRRTASTDDNLRRSSSVTAPFRSSQPVPTQAQVEPTNVSPVPSTSSARKRPRSLLINPFSGLSPISKSSSTQPPSDVRIQSAPAPIIVIGKDTVQQFPAPSGHVGPQISMDGGSLLPPPQPTPSQVNARVSFQLPTTLARIDDRPETPLSTCSTLVSEIEAVRRDAGTVVDDRMASTSVVPSIGRERIAASNDEAANPGTVHATPAASMGRSEVAKARRASLTTTEPVRPDGVRVNRSRFSLPARFRTESPITIGGADAAMKNTRGESRRTSLLSLASSSGSTSTTKKEGRMARFSRELSKPETQEVLRALAWRI